MSIVSPDGHSHWHTRVIPFRTSFGDKALHNLETPVPDYALLKACDGTIALSAIATQVGCTLADAADALAASCQEHLIDLRLDLSAEPEALHVGQFAVDVGWITPLQLEQALQGQRQSNKRLGVILEEHGWLTQRQVAFLVLLHMRFQEAIQQHPQFRRTLKP